MVQIQEVTTVTNTNNRKPRRQRKNRTSTALSLVQTLQRRRTRTRRGRNGSRVQQLGVTPAVHRYACTLRDPFCCGPTRLGWGDLSQSSDLGVSTARTVVSMTAGEALIVLSPDPTNLFYAGSSGAFTPGPNQVNIPSTVGGAITATNNQVVGVSNSASALANISQVRIVSAGVKVSPLLSMSNAPGIILMKNGGPLNNANGSAFNGGSILATVQTPDAQQLVGAYGCVVSASWRPIDPSSYEYFPVTGTSTPTRPVGNTPIIALTGFPAGTNVMIEFVYNYEFFHPLNQGDIGFTNSSDTSTPAESGTIEQVFSRIRSAGYDILSGATDGLKYGTLVAKEGIRDATNVAISQAANYAVNSVRQRLQNRAPRRAMLQLMRDEL